MISRLRRKHRITVQKVQATRDLTGSHGLGLRTTTSIRFFSMALLAALFAATTPIPTQAEGKPLQWRVRGSVAAAKAETSTKASTAPSIVVQASALRQLSPFAQPNTVQQLPAPGGLDLAPPANAPLKPVQPIVREGLRPSTVRLAQGEDPTPITAPANPTVEPPAVVEPAPAEALPVAPDPVAAPGIKLGPNTIAEDPPRFSSEVPSTRKPCGTNYNFRETCDNADRCEEAHEALLAAPLSSISLDITPNMMSGLTAITEEGVDPNSVLSVNAKRKWRDSRNRVIRVDAVKELGAPAEFFRGGMPGRVDLVAALEKVDGENVVLVTDEASMGAKVRVTLEIKELSIDDQFFINGRQWKNRHGQVLGSGRLVGYDNGLVAIANASGGSFRVPFRDLGMDELAFVTAHWGIPEECVLSSADFDYRNWTAITYTWKASGLCHKPLYYQDIQLERYGHSAGPVLQPILSGAHFFGATVVLPYNMGISPPNECKYALGYYRPGSCAPYMISPIPLSVRGGLSQAAAVAGLVYLLP
jgi:hypothetical protein